MDPQSGSDIQFDDPFGTEAEQPAGPVSPFKMAFRIVAGLVIAASFGVWVYAYSGQAGRDAPDLLGDRALAETAESICASAVEDVSALPGALDAVSGADRAAQIRLSTDRYESMVAEMENLGLFDERDRVIFEGWLGDWRVLNGDRRNYADAIEIDPEAQFLVSDIGVSERLDKRVTRFANTNLMLSCVAPTDVG